MTNKKFISEYRIYCAVVILSLIGIMIVALTAFNHDNIVKPSKPNYLGLAQMNLIPTTNSCSHPREAYIPTDVGLRDDKGHTYILLQSKFGDEVCPAFVE